MKHYGDITKINGAEIPLVDVICGGSPCQDLSVAGKREGLSGARSGLFMEQIRIVREQRNECIRQLQLRGADIDFRYIKPRYMVWENVPGAFSSNKGEDFRCVLEEICRVADQTAVVPMPEKGKWSTSGCIVGDGWSVAWRLHDAQFWGVPQRRRRIALVADFGSERAAEILFERESVSGDIESGATEREETAGTVVSDVKNPSGVQSIRFQERAGKPGGGKGILIQEEKTGALATHPQSVASFYPQMKAESQCYREDDISNTLVNGTNPGYHNGIMILNDKKTICIEGNGQRESHRGDGYIESDKMYTLNTIERHAVCASWDGSQVSPTLTANNAGGGQRMPDKENFNAVITYGLDRASFNQGKNAQYDFSVEEEKAQPLVARGPGGGTYKEQ